MRDIVRWGTAIAICLACGGLAHARGTCALATKRSPPLVVEVAPKEVSPFKLRLVGVAATIEPGGLETPAAVHVTGALVFDARLGNDQIPARLARAVDDRSGMVHLARATERLTLHANVRAKLVDADVELPGVTLRGLTLPCDALTLEEVEPPEASLEDAGETRYVAKGAALHLRSAPGGRGAAIEVAVADPGALELARVEEQAGWMRVTAGWPDGTTLQGWVKRDELVLEGVRHERVGELVPRAGEAPTCEPPRVAANERIVTARVAVGTRVFAARYLGPWAKVVDGSKLLLRVRPKDDWVELVGVPGVACALDDAWIARAAATLADAPAPSK